MNTTSFDEEILACHFLKIPVIPNLSSIRKEKTSFKTQVFNHFEINHKEWEIELCYYQNNLPIYPDKFKQKHG